MKTSEKCAQAGFERAGARRVDANDAGGRIVGVGAIDFFQPPAQFGLLFGG